MHLFGRIFVVMTLLAFETRQTNADCATIGRHAIATHDRLVAATRVYKNEISEFTSRPITIDNLSKAIASYGKMKSVMDETIAVLLQSKAENCFGKDADQWNAAIASFQAESTDMANTRDSFIEMRSQMIRKESAEAQNGSPSEPSPQTQTDPSKKSRDQFREAATCVAYWQIANECLPTMVPPKQAQETRLYMDMLLETMTNHLADLGKEAQVSTAAQGRFVTTTKESLYRLIDRQCTNFSRLIPSYRNTCAALAKNYDETLKRDLHKRADVPVISGDHWVSDTGTATKRCLALFNKRFHNDTTKNFANCMTDQVQKATEPCVGVTNFSDCMMQNSLRVMNSCDLTHC